MESRIKHIIKEEIEKVLAEKRLKNDINYLHPFNFMTYRENGEKKQWVYGLSHNRNDLLVEVTLLNNQWYFKIESDTKHVEQIAEVQWGPFNSYEEFVYEINHRLDNNMQLSTGNLNNHSDDAVDDDIMERAKDLLAKGDVLMSLKGGNLEDVKKLYLLVKDCQGLDKKDFVEKIRDAYDSVRGFGNTLNKISQIDYYKKLEKYQGH